MTTTFCFNANNLEKAKEIVSKYPPQNRFSAIMPLLTLAQDQNGGYLNKHVITYLANYLQVSEMAFFEVANFYHMYQLKPVGKYHISFCNSVVCFLKNGNDLFNYIKEITGLQTASVSADGLFSIQSVGCLGVCVGAPAIKINNFYYEDLTKDKLLTLINNLKAGKPLEELIIVKKPVHI